MQEGGSGGGDVVTVMGVLRMSTEECDDLSKVDGACGDCRQRALGQRARNTEVKRPGTRERVVRAGGAPEANAELPASLAYVRAWEETLGVGVVGCGE